jgi:hypothetical protein
VNLTASDGLRHSMATRRQRVLLDDIGEEVGTEVAYLKAAWADPVLYGGRGERTGVDVDVLVHPRRFEAFAAALTARGFTRQVHPRHPVSAYAGKDWTFAAPRGYIQVDLHRALAMVPWFDLGGEGPLARSIEYDSVDGPIRSLSPEDQVVFLAAHYATHVFDLDDRHLTDVVRLLEQRSVDWGLVIERASAAHLLAALSLCAAGLEGRGVAVPGALVAPVGSLGLRRRCLEQVVAVPELERRIPRSRALDVLVVLPLLSDRVAALPRFMARYMSHRVADWARARSPQG